MNNWREVKLGDIADIGTGKTNRQDETKNGAYPLFDRSSVVKRSDKYLFDCKAVIIPGEGKEFLPRYFSGKFDLHQRAYRITSKSEASVKTKFLYYYLNQHRDYWERVAVGTTVKSLRLHSFTDFPVKLPPIEEQKAIVHVLGMLDDKIELNQQMNETLESMAQAIFKDWFIDFGPTRRKMEGATDLDVILGGLLRTSEKAREIVDLFPSALTDNSLPKKWKYTTVGERFDVRIGRTPPRKESWHFTKQTTGVPWLSIRDLADCGVFVHQTAERLTGCSIKNCRIPLVMAGTVLVSFKLTVGRVSIAECMMTTNEAIAHLNSTDRSPMPYFTYCWMKNFDYSSLGSTSSIATAVNSKSIRKIPFPEFGVDVENEFGLLIKPIFELILINAKQNRILLATRDLILPNFISGKIHSHELRMIS
ncbi:restriction endonuclease subunit S [Thioalkalivibrio sp. HK1]|uniref:restriction endonuclease subunit S n=1 Tax=Thioalkalivibrio sp. HK1 TaxID=1469245 RepID=UPI000686654A|nr:restriction endonuclease subunit S [Thioalkalivibrio sp. HK1]